MAGEDGRRFGLCQTTAVLLLLCTLAPCLSSFILYGLSKTDARDIEGTMKGVRTGKFLFNGKGLDSQSESASAAATGNKGLLDLDLYQTDGGGKITQFKQCHTY